LDRRTTSPRRPRIEDAKVATTSGPVPGFQPSADAFAAADELVALLRSALRHAADSGQLGPNAASERAVALLSTLHFGVLSQHLANDPNGDWDHGLFTSLHPTVLDLFEAAYPPPSESVSRTTSTP
jgi:hypothetical protein